MLMLDVCFPFIKYFSKYDKLNILCSFVNRKTVLFLVLLVEVFFYGLVK